MTLRYDPNWIPPDNKVYTRATGWTDQSAVASWFDEQEATVAIKGKYVSVDPILLANDYGQEMEIAQELKRIEDGLKIRLQDVQATLDKLEAGIERLEALKENL